ncbi:MAG: type I phosphomannose isomerase catalytic subunit [Chloroflexia bacterium]
MNEAYPLLLKPEFHERVWGGRRLADLLGAELPDGPIGESWSMGTDSRVLNGPLAGRRLGDLVGEKPAAMLGRLPSLAERTDLPLLFKIIDAQDRLSIQVHPDDHYARTVEGVPFGKTEAWYVLDASPGAYVIHGFERAVTPDEVRASLADGSLPGLLHRVELRAGDTFFVPAGTVHAIGGGLLLGEIQENSDITYRLYDWGRPRETHVEQSLAVMHPRPSGFGPTRALEVAASSSTLGFLVACRYFLYQSLEVHGALPLETKGRSFHVLFCYAGTGTIRYAGGEAAFASGQTFFLPADLGTYTLAGEGCQLLRALVPDMQADVIGPLLEAGFTAAQVDTLGGPPGNEIERAIAPACNV